MNAPNPVNQTTALFCQSQSDGRIAPAWSQAREAELRGHFEVGLTIADRYRLQDLLGDGAMGRVFLARDLRLDRPVAVKVVLHNRDVENLEAILQREARLGASLSHPGIAAVYDFGFHDGKSFTVFEYIEGETLRSLLHRRGKLPLDEALPIIRDLAAALDFAHARGVVHRDLKPENICLTRGGEFKILDLGLARDIAHDVETGTYSGTPAYSSPEQAECRMTDGKSDQYALGLIVFEMLSGRQAFSATDPWQLLRQQIEAPPPRIRDLLGDFPDRAERVLLRALHKQRAERFATCQEFAQDLASGVRAGSSRHVVSTSVEDRIGFYLAHVAEESLLARNLAHALRQQKYSTWYYGRDALPGIPFTTQSRKAIERSQAMVLLVSHPALRSRDFERELEYAYDIGRPLLPLLIDLSREEFEELAPAWRRMLGISPIVEFRRAEGMASLMSRLAGAAESLSIPKSAELADAGLPAAVRCSGPIWATDANQIDIHDLDRVLFRNETIDDFLSRKHRHFVSASKGFGKTLLLTYKRRQLALAGDASAVTLVPEGRPYLDFMSEMRSLSANYEKPLSDLSTTKRLWSAAFRISALSHYPGVIQAEDEVELRAFPTRMQGWLRGGKIQPTVVFKEATALRVSELNQWIDRTENFLDQKMRQIHGATCFFVDKVDQAIRHLSRDAWIAIQAGLIEAAWEMMNANSHLKIYATIRQEAFSNYESDIKSNLFAATTSLNYTDEEIHALLDQLARCYEGCDSFTDFLGLNVLRHGRRPIPEDSFQYVRRHTCGRPRDLVAIASEISSKRSRMSERRLREVVQQTSSHVVVANIFEEVRVFLSCLDDRESRMRFLAAIPGNILEKRDAIRVCEQFNGLEAGTLTHFGEDSSEIFHPFRDLYFAGLLGVVESDLEHGVQRQRFRRPHDSLAQANSELPASDVFFLHPALDTFIRSQRTRTRFIQCQHIPVGDGLAWEPYDVKVLQIEKHLAMVNHRTFIELTHQVVKRIQALLKSRKPSFARLEIESSHEWQSLGSHEDDPSCGDVLIWLHAFLEELDD